MATGKNPRRYRLFYIHYLDHEGRLRPACPVRRDYGFFWSALSREKFKVGVLDVPFVIMRIEKEGFFVSGKFRNMLGTSPPSMRSEIPCYELNPPDWSKIEEYNLRVLKENVQGRKSA